MGAFIGLLLGLVCIGAVFGIFVRIDHPITNAIMGILILAFLILYIIGCFKTGFWSVTLVTILMGLPVAFGFGLVVRDDEKSNNRTKEISWKNPLEINCTIVPRNIPVYNEADALKLLEYEYSESVHEFNELANIRNVEDKGDIEDMLWPFEQFLKDASTHIVEIYPPSGAGTDGEFSLFLKTHDGKDIGYYKSFAHRKDPDGVIHRYCYLKYHGWKVNYDLVTGDDTKYFWSLRNEKESYWLHPLYGKCIVDNNK